MAKASETLKLLREVITEKFVETHGLPVADANKFALSAVAAIQEHFRGDAIYIAVGNAERLEKRDLEMWDAFDGSNYASLGMRYGMTERQVYTRIKKIRPIAMSLLQGSLFDDE
jgi:Mor family transcriptional regulator